MIYDHECNGAEVRGNFCDVSLSCQMPRRTLGAERGELGAERHVAFEVGSICRAYGGAFGSLRTHHKNFPAPPHHCIRDRKSS